MMHKYIEVEETRDGFMITDLSHWFEVSEREFHWREMRDHKSRFVTVAGREVTYHVAGLGSDAKRCMQFAIWYHIEKSQGKIKKYELE